MNPPAGWRAMQVAVRNLGREGFAATAISAVDVALWDLKAVLLDLPLASLAWLAIAKPCRSTAAAASPATTTASSRASSPVGWKRTAAAGSR